MKYWIKQHINKWVILGGVLIFLLTLIFWLFVLWFFTPARSHSGPSSAVITVMAAPTFTGLPPTEMPTQAVQLEPTEISLPTGIVIGSYVIVSGTGSDGLRVREGPGINNPIDFLAREGEKFNVTGGPQDEDGYQWWYLVGVDDEKRSGWAVENYLLLSAGP